MLRHASGLAAVALAQSPLLAPSALGGLAAATPRLSSLLQSSLGGFASSTSGQQRWGFATVRGGSTRIGWHPLHGVHLPDR